MLEAVRLVRSELPAEKAVIGFCGGPFTVAGYLVEGRPSRELPRTKALMLSEPETWDALMAKLADVFAAYVAAKVRAGADVVQLFDSWVGTLSPAQYRERVAPWSSRILDAVDVPTIHFGTGASHLLGDLAAAGGDVIGLDWRLAARRRAGRSPATAPSRGTSTRPCSPRRGTSSSARHSTCSLAPTVARVTSSTSVTACCPRPSRAT